MYSPEEDKCYTMGLGAYQFTQEIDRFQEVYGAAVDNNMKNMSYMN